MKPTTQDQGYHALWVIGLLPSIGCASVDKASNVEFVRMRGALRRLNARSFALLT